MGLSFLHPSLKNLCCNSPWNYAVFWKRENRPETVLSWEDGFFNIQRLKFSAEDFHLEDSNEILLSALSSNPWSYPFGDAEAEMPSSSHVIGKGLVGEVALTRKARWIYAGNLADDIFISESFPECPDEWLLHFAAGIKTILLLPVDPYGVLQLGSVETVAEDTTLLSCVEDVLVCLEKSELPDWKYFIRELSLLFLLESCKEPAAYTTGNTFEDQMALHPVNQLMTDYLHGTTETPSTYSLESGSACENGDQVLGMIPMAEPYQLNSSRELHHEDISLTSIFSDWEMHEGFLSELEYMNLPGCAFEQETGSIFSFPEEYEQLETVTEDQIHQFSLHDSVLHSVGNKVGSHSITAPVLDSVANDAEMKPLMKAAVGSLDGTSSCMSSITSLNIAEPKHLVSAIQRHEHHQKDTWNFFAAPSVPSVHRKKSDHVSRLSKSNKRKDCSGYNHRPRPRDRQLIQDRIKELRALVPNSEKCSIDGLLDKTIKHMMFLRNVTDQADKLKKHEADEMKSRSATINSSHHTAGSWAVESGTDQHSCPIAVKDLDQPGHMLIEMLCADYDRFLEIADVIHRLQLTVVKGVMDKSSDRSSARFIVETSGSFHRLDIFWPLMRLLQQHPSPFSSDTKIPSAPIHKEGNSPSPATHRR